MKIKFGVQCSSYFRRFPFVVVDVGARGGIKKEWIPLSRYLKYVAFEPDPIECKKLSEQKRDHEAVFYGKALWSSKAELPLYLTKNEGFSSVYLPDQDFLEFFSPKNISGYAVTKKITMHADRLDNIISNDEKQSIDFIKVDAEGCASDVLIGSEAVLAESAVIGIQVEAEFNAKYKGQPLFSEVDRAIRKHHYQLFHAETCCWKRKAGLKTGGSQGQLMHGDISYFLDPVVYFSKIANRSSDEQIAKIIKYIVFSCLYGVYDLAFDVLRLASKKNVLPSALAEELEAALSRSETILFRIPKLQNSTALREHFYHAFMLLGGIWLRRAGYWKNRISLK